MSMTHWYCIHAKRYRESWVAHQLTESCDEVYLPLLRQQRRVRRQVKWVIEPFFPGYLFARFAVEERFRAVRYTPGVISVVSPRGGWPAEVDEGIITALRRHAVNGYIEVQPAPLCLGDELEVIEGPFQGLQGLFERELKGGERVAVLLDLLSA